MIKFSFKIGRYATLLPKYNYSLPKLTHQIDMANLTSFALEQRVPTSTFIEKMNAFGFWNMYYTLDEFSRQLLFYLANDVGLGLSTSIIIITLGFKAFFSPTTLLAQIGALKMNVLNQQFKVYQERIRDAQRIRNFNLMKQSQKNFFDLRKRHGIKTWHGLFNLFQIPLSLTWFFSLRYVTILPEVFPTVKTQGILWFQDLSVYDPYFILPFLSAFTSYYNISRSPNIAANMNSIPIMVKISQYLRYLPFVSLPFLAFFPAGLNLYWFFMALSQTFIIMSVNNNRVRAYFKVSQQIKTEKIIRAFVVQDKLKNQFKQIQQPTSQSEPVTQKVQQQEQFKAKKEKLLNLQSQAKNPTGEGIKISFQRPKKNKKQ